MTKVHIAGFPANGKQQCVRCHSVINRGPSFWEPGGFVRSTRGSMSAVPWFATSPMCGKPSTENVTGLMRQRIREAEGRG